MCGKRETHAFSRKEYGLEICGISDPSSNLESDSLFRPSPTRSCFLSWDLPPDHIKQVRIVVHAPPNMWRLTIALLAPMIMGI